MKRSKLFITGILLFSLFFSCVNARIKMNNEMNNVHPGMSISEFKEAVTGETLVQMLDTYACYKVEKQSAKFGEPGGYIYETRFFYFKDDKLYRIDQGKRPVDLQIEINHNSK